MTYVYTTHAYNTCIQHMVMKITQGVGYAPRVLVRLTCIPPEADGEDNTHADKDITHDDKDNNNNKSRHALVHVELSLDARIVAVKLGLTKPLIAQPLLGLHHGGGGGAAVHHVPRVKVCIGTNKKTTKTTKQQTHVKE